MKYHLLSENGLCWIALVSSSECTGTWCSIARSRVCLVGKSIYLATLYINIK